MKWLLLAMSVCLSQSICAQQTKFSITIYFQQLSHPQKFYVAQCDEKKIDSFSFPSNDTLIYTGTISKPGLFQVMTDKSGAIQTWVDSVPITIFCSEEKKQNNTYRLNINDLRGSVDARLLFQKSLPDSFSQSFGPNMSQAEGDSIMKSLFYFRAFQKIDSLFKLYPNSPIIPFYISYYQNTLGPETVSFLFYRLNDQIQNSDESSSIKQYLLRSSLVQKGAIIDNFKMKDQSENELSLESVKAKFILIDFWASWCGPCRAENPHLKEVYQKYRDKGFEIISVSLDEKREDWRKAIQKDGLPWLQVSDLNGRNNKLAIRYKIGPIPYYFLIDEQHRVVDIPYNSYVLDKTLASLLK